VVLVNMVVSADGATAVDGRAGDMGGEPDRRLFHALRTVPDVILVGAGTARAENYGPPKARPGRPAPRLAVVTGSGRLEPSLRFFAAADPALPPPFVITVADCPPERLAALEERAEVIQAGASAADLGVALGALRQRGAQVVLCEGGPTLNGQLVARDLVDEWCLSVAPAPRQRDLVASGRRRRRHAAPAGDARSPARAGWRAVRPLPPDRPGDGQRARFDSSVTSLAKSAGSSKPL
jgi:riboflavin biosynthesis pyrimidine reductase